MATVNFSVPEEIKARFNQTFSQTNKSAIIAELMARAVDEAEQKKASDPAVKRVLARRTKKPAVSGTAVRVVARVLVVTPDKEFQAQGLERYCIHADR